MTGGTDDGKTAFFLHFRCQFDIGTTAGHVRSDSHGAKETLLALHLLSRLSVFRLVQHILIAFCRCFLTESLAIAGNVAGAHGGAAGFGHDLCLLLMELGIKHLMGDLTHVEHLAEQLRDLH